MNYDVYDVNLMTDEQTVYIFLKADLSIWITKLHYFSCILFFYLRTR